MWPSCSEVVTLAVCGQWAQFPSERAFSRDALSHVRTAFPTVLEREQCNRSQRTSRDVIVALRVSLVEQMQTQCCLYEALDSSGIPIRDAKQRGTGWLAGQTDIGWSNRIGWYKEAIGIPLLPARIAILPLDKLDPLKRGLKHPWSVTGLPTCG